MSSMEPPLAVGYFRIAKQISESSSYRIKVGAVLADKRPISFGFNKLKSHPKFANPTFNIRVSIHAEIDCLLKAKKGKKGNTIYVYREDSKGNPALSRPCSNCIEELKRAGVHKIYYSVSEFPFWKMELI